MGRALGFKNRRIWLYFRVRNVWTWTYLTCLNLTSLFGKWGCIMGPSASCHAVHTLFLILVAPHKGGTGISFTQERKPRFRKGKWFTDSYTARKRWSQDADPGFSGSKVRWKKMFSLLLSPLLISLSASEIIGKVRLDWWMGFGKMS